MKHTRLLFSALMMLVMMAMPAKLWAQSTFSGSGSGTSADPYQIATAAQLSELSAVVNEGNATYNAASVYYVLTDNIDLSTVCYAAAGDTVNWTPIGTESNPFKGTFDGQGHSITGMYIHYATLNQGLFGKTNGATVKDFSISGEMTSGTSNDNGSVQCIGGAIGWAYNSTVEDITSNVNITLDEGITQKLMGGVVGDCDGTTISGCTYTGTLDAGATGDCVGGITGYFRCDAKTTKAYQIINCCNAGKVTTTANSIAVAGILGYQNDADFMGIHNCLNLGKIETGASTTGAIYGCYRKNTASVGANNYYKAGSATNGVMNDQSSQSAASVCTSVSNDQLTKGEVCYKLNGSTSTGTLAWYQTLNTDTVPVLKRTSSNTVYYGYSDHTLIYANTALSATPEHNFVDGVCSVCGAYDNEPVKVTAANASGLGLNASYVDYYAITNAAELKWFANVVNNANATYNNIKVVLAANIESLGAWVPVGTETATFNGTFDGNGKSISGMTIAYTTSYQGLFGNVNGATLKNFTVSGTMTSSTNGISEIGGVVGKALSSTIENVVSNVNITVTGATQSHIAGIVGNCDNTTVNLCANNGAVNAGASTDCIAGIAGYARQNAKITNCLNAGAISTTGTDAHIAGIIGYCNHGSFDGVSKCLNIGSITGSASTAGAIFGCFGSDLSTAGNNYNYYKVGTADNAVGENPGGKVFSDRFLPITVDQLRNGNVCYRLNGKTSTGSLTWYQTIGSDTIPVHNNTHQVVYNDGGSYNNPYTVTAGTAGYNAKEAVGKAFDRSTSTKWCCTSGSGTSIFVEFNTSNPMKVGSYTFTTADDTQSNSNRNPKTWVLKGKVNSTDSVWTVIDSRTNSTKMPAANYSAVTFYLPALTATAYKYFRIEFTHAQSTTFQLSEITLSSAACEHSYDAITHYCSKCGSYDATYVKAYGTSGTVNWVLCNDSTFFFHPTTGTSGTLGTWNLDNTPWLTHVAAIKTVAFYGTINAGTSIRSMFGGCVNLTSVNFTNFSTTNATMMYHMFYDCWKLESINWGSTFSTAKVEDMGYMFCNCYKLTSIDLSGFNTEKVTSMNDMFFQCKELTSLDLSSFNTACVRSMIGMFGDCTKLQSLTLGNFDMQLVGYVSNMFNNSALKNLTLKAMPYLMSNTFNTKFTGAGVTVNYQLDDNSVIYTGTNYLPAATVAPTYTRTIAATSNWGTLVLPFEVASNANVQLYELTAANGSTLTFSPVTTVAANTPCVFKKLTADATSVTFTATSVAAPVAAAPAEPAAVNGLSIRGTYTALTNQTGMYFIAQNAFYKAVDAITINPFRAWFEGTIAGAPSRFDIEESTDVATSLDQFGASEQAVKVLIDGKVYILRDGEIYDLLGRKL